MAELEQGAIYAYDANKEVDASLDPFTTFLMRAKIIEPSSIASQQILSLKGDQTYA